MQSSQVMFTDLWSNLENLTDHYLSDDDHNQTNSSLEDLIDNTILESPPSSPLPPRYQTQNHSVPSATDFPGQYGFQLAFSPPAKDTKSTSWTYSALSKKLYARMAMSCPVQFKTTFSPPPSTFIRATAIYKEPQHVQSTVKRCPNHASSLQHNENHPAPNHLVRCENLNAVYEEDAFTQRHSVLIPYHSAQPGSDCIVQLYKFMCLGSCVGGPNRRPLQIVFTLEHNQVVLGRAAVDIRICACPGRDKKVDENSLRCPSSKNKSIKRPLLGNVIQSSYKKTKLDEDVFSLVIHGKENFELLKTIRDSLEMASYFTSQ